MEQILDLSGEECATMTMTSDGTLLRIDSKLRFTPQIDNLYSFIFRWKNLLNILKAYFHVYCIKKFLLSGIKKPHK